MKKTILILLLSIFVISCNNNKKVEKVVNDPHWYKDSGGECSHGTLCGQGGGWKLSNLKVTAENKI